MRDPAMNSPKTPFCVHNKDNDYFRIADDPDTSSSRLETDAGALEATAARHSHRQEQYLAASSFVRLRPQ
jgi:hypothetical protein